MQVPVTKKFVPAANHPFRIRNGNGVKLAKEKALAKKKEFMPSCSGCGIPSYTYLCMDCEGHYG